MSVNVPSTGLRSLVSACFEHAGLGEIDANGVSEALVEANLRGHDSHGIARVPAYLSRVVSGVAGGGERIQAPEGEGPMRRLDAGAALGVLAAGRGTELAIALAADHGIGLVAVGNSSHFGAAGLYARRLAGQGLIGLAATNGPANMAPYGSADPFLGTNAFSLGMPLSGDDQFVLDMSCSITARGKIIRRRDLGEPLEPGVAIDSDGNPTEDPVAALAGAVLPFAGAKGSGLALAISLAVAALAGASFDDEAGRMHGTEARPQDIGHLFLAIDPWRLADRDLVQQRIAGLIDRLHALRPSPGHDRVLYPGERGERERRKRLTEGVPVAIAELEAIAIACEELGFDHGARRARCLAATDH